MGEELVNKIEGKPDFERFQCTSRNPKRSHSPFGFDSKRMSRTPRAISPEEEEEKRERSLSKGKRSSSAKANPEDDKLVQYLFDDIGPVKKNFFVVSLRILEQTRAHLHYGRHKISHAKTKVDCSI